MTTIDDDDAGVTGLPNLIEQILLFALGAIGAFMLGIGLLLFDLGPAAAAEASDAPRAGTLMIGNTEAQRLGLDVDVTVSGPTVRARVTQIFRNPTKQWVEATYMYPLPSGGAVDTLKMVIGDRVVIGDIKERQQARAVYDAAKRNGQKAALVEQQRPNIFTNRVANIGPGETVLVQIEYQEPVHQDGNAFSLRIPMVVGPRYNPAPLVQSVDMRDDGGGWGSAITQPVLDPAENAPVNPTTITVRLMAGFPLGHVTSAYHRVKIDSPDAATRIVSLADGPVPADRDFELSWTSAAQTAPSVGLFREHVGASDYVLAYVTPPAASGEHKPRPREVVFVIDNSGSMGGTSIAQAKASLLYALGRLQPGDRFNVIRFDHTMTMLFPASVVADGDHVSRATSFVSGLQAAGGTEMVPAMRAALNDDATNEAGALRQVVFLTDGAIGNEQQLFDTITALRGRSRVFMVGIGSAPNTFLMTRAAELGRGSFTHIGATNEVEERMRDLFAKLENPVVTGLAATFSDAKADMTPAVVPDLYRGEPLVLAARLDQLKGNVTLTGRIGEQPWTVTLPLDHAAEGKGLSKLWARRMIDDAEVARTMNRITPADADSAILKLALEHQLVTRLTSLVAVDQAITRPAGEPLKLSELPVNLPAGWDFAKVFGEHPPRHTPPVERRAEITPQPATVQLPQTATDAELKLIIGLALLSLSLMLTVKRCAA